MPEEDDGFERGRLHRKGVRPLWVALGVVCVGLGVLGLALPLLPTTPFLLLASYAFARSSPRLHRWLVSHARLGPLIEDWQRFGAISRRAKATAVGLMGAAFVGSLLAGFGGPVLVLQAFVLVGVAAFLLTRPEPPAR